MKRYCVIVLVLYSYHYFCPTIAFSATTKKPVERAFSLVIREGFGSISVGDLNTTLYTFNHNPGYEYLRENHPERCLGEILEVPAGYKDWEVEFQWAAWWGLSIGLALSGPTAFYDKSSLTYSIAQGLRQTDDDSFESEIRISAPVKLSLYRSFLIMPRVNILINGGIGYYQASMAQTWTSNIHLPSDGQSLSSLYWDVKGSRIGLHFGFAVEYEFSDRFSIMAESLWRFANISSLEGRLELTRRHFDEYGALAGSSDFTDVGPLYHYYGEDLLFGNEIEKLVVSSLEVPWTGLDYPRDIRKAYLDLSGFTLKIGLKIRLF